MAGLDLPYVLDIHHHVGDARAVMAMVEGRPGGMGDAEYRQVELEKRTGIMDEGGVTQALVIPGHGYSRANGIADTCAQNDAIAAYRDACPERFPAACGIVEPRDAEVSLPEIERCAQDLGLVAMSFHTRFQGVSLDNHWVDTYVGAMADVGMTPILHALDENVDEALWKVGQLAKRHPDTTLVVFDGYSTFEGTKHCAFLAECFDNLVFDISLSYNFDFIEAHMKTHGAERYVFGTDLYSWPLGVRITHLLGQIHESSLSDDEKAALLGGNARRVLGLDEKAPG
jgi:predicted TIM-barrel fold metal-dependent hydrolase